MHDDHGTTPQVSVVIPSYQNGHTLVHCLRALSRQSLALDRFEVIVVIDGSTDGTRDLVTALTLPLRLSVIEQPNRGRAAALNRGVANARGEFVVIIDADIVVNASFLERHVHGHSRGDVVVGPIPLADASPHSFVTDGVELWADEHTRCLEQNADAVPYGEVFGGNYSMRREMYLGLGGNRDDLRRSEDHQLGRKLAAAGLRVVYEPEAIAAQIYDKTVPELFRDFYVDGRSQVQLVAEYPEVREELLLSQYHRMSLLKRFTRPFFRRRGALADGVLSVFEAGLELGRRRGLRSRLLAAVQGVILDGLYFRGVTDAAGSEQRFVELTGELAGVDLGNDRRDSQVGRVESTASR